MLLAVEDNMVDKVWGSSRPARPNSELIILGKEYSGTCVLFFPMVS